MRLGLSCPSVCCRIMRNTLSGLLSVVLLLSVHLLFPSYAQGCPTPADVNVSNVTSYSAQVSWTGVADRYRIMVTTSSSVTDPGSFLYWDIDTIVTTNPATIGIMPNTRYFVYMQCICANDTGDITSVPLSFDSQCGVVMYLPWRENLEAGENGTVVDLPCWLNEHLEGISNRLAEFSNEDVDGNTSMKMAFPKAATSRIRLTFPSFNIPSADTHQFGFSIYRHQEAAPDEGVSVIMQNADSSFDSVFVPVNISVAGGVGTETANGWYSYNFVFSREGVNNVVLQGYSNDSSAVYIDDICVRAVPTCHRITGVSLRDNQPGRTVIQWTATTAESYQVVCATQPIEPERIDRVPADWIVYNNPSVTADSAVITGINPGTRYYVYVRGVCTDENSDWSDCLTYRSVCAPFTVTASNIYTNGFEEGDDMSRDLPCTEIITTATGQWPAVLDYPYYAHSGDRLLYFGGDAGTDDTSYVALAEIGNALNTLRLRFWLHGLAEDVTGNDSIIVGVMTDPQDVTTFVRVAGFRSSLTAYDDGYEEIEVLFNNYAGPHGRLALMRVPVESQGWFDSFYYGSAVDDVTIDLIPECERVTGVRAHAVTGSSAVIAWNATDATGYHVLVTDTPVNPLRPDDPDIVYSDSVSGDSVEVTLLSPVTDYYVYVRGICGAGNYGDFSKEYSFRTAGTLPYFQYFETVGVFPEEMTEYVVYHNLDSVVAGSEAAMVNPYPDFDVNDILGEDTVTVRFNFFGDETFRMFSTPLFAFDGTEGTSLSFDVCKRAYGVADPASDGTNYDDRFYILAADNDMTTFIKLDTWTNDTLGGGNHSLRDDIGTSFSHWTVDLSPLGDSYRIVFAVGSLVENDDYDIHFDNIVIAKPHSDSVTISVVSSDVTMGNVTGAGRYAFGEKVTIQAIANEGYRFVKWSDNDTTERRTFYAAEDLSLTAGFEATVSLDNTMEASVVVYSENRRIVLNGAEGRAVSLYDAFGRLISAVANASSDECFKVNAAGVYFIRISGLKTQTFNIVCK